MSRSICVMTALMATWLMVGGCQTARVAEPLTQRQAVEGDEGRLEFWHSLPESKLVSNDEAFHALLLYFDGKDESGSYDQRVATLKSRGWLPDNFSAPADQIITRGTIAVALVQAMQIKGGAIMHVFGPSPRYATRELAYMNLYPLSSPQQTFNGVQLVELISKVEDYQRSHPSLETPQPPLTPKAPPPGALAQKPTLAPGERVMQVTARRQQIAALLMAMIAHPTMLAQAQPPAADPAAPAAAPADPNALPVQITAVQGLVQVRAADDQPWQPAQVGMQLTTGAEFRTGPRSSVVFKVGPTQTVTLDRLGTVKVLDALRRTDGAVVTDVGMKYGRSTMQVQTAGVEHQSRIRSPGATLSVRGSVGSLEDIGNTLRAAGLEGDVSWARLQGQFIVLPPPSEHEGNDTSTAENRLADGTFNPFMFGTTPLEQFLYSYFNGGAFQNQQAGFDVFRDLQSSSGVPDDGSTGGFVNATIILPLVFNLFDFGAVDGDTIILTVRDRSGTVISPMQIVLPGPPGPVFSPEVQAGRITITVQAVNEGTSSPNTGQITLQSQVTEGPSTQVYNLLTGETGTLVLRAVPGNGGGGGEELVLTRKKRR